MGIKGAMIAASVAGMFAMGAARVASAGDKKAEEVNCHGINACKGQGNMKVSKDDCAAKGGKVVK